MKLPDINLWLALSISSHDHHDAATAWLDQQEEARSIIACRVTQQGYLRLLTQTDFLPRYGIPALANADAWAAWHVLLEDDRVVFHAEPEGLERSWREFGARPQASSKLWMDAYLAAFAVTASLEMVTFDKGFKKFDGLKLELLPI
jgi:toxin-antitoxin system PIN domain toxin